MQILHRITTIVDSGAIMQSLKKAKLDAEEPYRWDVMEKRILSVQFCFLQALHGG